MRLAVTGVGTVSPFGVGRETFEGAFADVEAARASAFRGPSEVLDAEKIPDPHTAEVWGWDPKQHLGPKGHRSYDRLTKFLIAAATSALEDAGLKKEREFTGILEATQIGVCSATAYGSLDAITELNRVAELEDPRYINPTRFPNTVINAAAGYVSIWEDLQAPNTTIVDGNCGALDAVLTAATHLTHRRGDAFLVGGGEVVSEPLFLALTKLGVIARGGRGGVEMGEGAAYLVVERAEDALARGATINAEIVGYGTAFEPPPSEALLVNASADAVARACTGALEEAGIEPKDVDVVSCAAGGIDAIDRAEAEGLRSLFGDQVAIASLKRLHGETFGAAGAFGMVGALAWLSGAPVGPLIAGTASKDVRTVLVTTVGFYGNVSVVVLRRAAN
ncbi:MAG: beta-ketoacyl synthase N-terminal-like domain-containing protein [Myxococcota bacterium]